MVRYFLPLFLDKHGASCGWVVLRVFPVDQNFHPDIRASLCLPSLTLSLSLFLGFVSWRAWVCPTTLCASFLPLCATSPRSRSSTSLETASPVCLQKWRRSTSEWRSRRGRLVLCCRSWVLTTQRFWFWSHADAALRPNGSQMSYFSFQTNLKVVFNIGTCQHQRTWHKPGHSCPSRNRNVTIMKIRGWRCLIHRLQN